MIKELTLGNKKVKFIVKDTSEHIQKHWLGGGFYEANRNGLLSFMLNSKETYQGKTVLDIGACIGNHSIFFDKILGMNVYSFEPQIDNYNHLVENIELNESNAVAFNVALGEKEGRVSMSYPKDNIGMSKVVNGNDVSVVPLDDLNLYADVIKIDVEGYNEQVLKGGEKTIKSAKVIFIECEKDEILEKTDKIMSDYGFKRASIVFNHTPTYLWH